MHEVRRLSPEDASPDADGASDDALVDAPIDATTVADDGRRRRASDVLAMGLDGTVLHHR